MNSQLDELQLWTARNLIRRADLLNEKFGASGWNGYPPQPMEGIETDSQVRGGGVVEDEWQQLQQRGFLQDPETGVLRLAPIVAFPGIVLAPWLIKGVQTRPWMTLWLQFRYKMGLTVFHYKPGPEGPRADSTGWNGTLTDAKAKLMWVDADESLVAKNQIFESTRQYSGPEKGEFVWHGIIGGTDHRGVYSAESSLDYMNDTCGQLAVPF